ncbi:MAG: HNH endonuclease family protein, partial [Chitinispirillaceae bacterium]|nr:HNH endonuclease family protein [Chitinispirillaceae bacterium]
QDELRTVYIDDETFKNSFSTKVFDTRKNRAKKIVRYILISIENHLYNKDYHLFDTDATIEHIYPENFMEGDEKLDENMIYRLGNLTLLESKLNSECANKKFNTKREVYKRSQYGISNSIADSDYEEWGIEEIRTRQQQLAKSATAIWRLPFGNK